MKQKKEKGLQSVFVGLDIAKQEIEICVLDKDGLEMHRFQVSNSKLGFHKMIESLIGYKQPVFGIESTGPYSGNVVKFLKKISAEVILSNPFHISRLREVFSKSVKNDLVDAFVIAQALRMNILKDSQKEDKYVFLQDLLERYYDLMDRKTALGNQLRSNLIETFPELDKCFSNISCNAALAILSQWQTADDLLQEEEMRIRLVINNSKGRISTKKFDALRVACRASSGWKTTACHKAIIKSQVRELVLIIDEIKNIQEAVDEYCLEFRREIELLQSVPGVSKQISYLFLAVIGDHTRFDPAGDGKGAKRLSSYLGFGLMEYSSGPRSYKFGMSKRGNSKLRGLLYMASLVCIGKKLDIARDFEGYRNRCGNGKKAVNAMAHGIARRCYGVLKSGKTYDPSIPRNIAA